VGHRDFCKSRRLYFLLWKNKLKLLIVNRIFLPYIIVSTVRRIEFVSDRVSYRVLRGRWCNITLLYVHAQVRRKTMTQNTVFIGN